MNWRNTYHDLSTQEKRQLRQHVLNECQISKGAFYNYLDGKQPKKIINERITNLVNSFQVLSTPFGSFEEL